MGNVTAALGHTEEVVAGYAATCTQTGLMAHSKCTVCQKLFDENKREVSAESLVLPIDGRAHNLGEWQAEVPATTENAGTKAHYRCADCQKTFAADGGEIVDLTIPKLEETPGGDITTPAEDVTTPAENVTTPAEDITTPAEDVTTPVEDVTIPVEEVTTPAPDDEMIDADAQPEEEPEEEPSKDGLSGGAVAGIVVGSTIVAGAGGFSIFWFVVQKKSVTDLVTATKAVAAKAGTACKKAAGKIKKLFAKK